MLPPVLELLVGRGLTAEVVSGLEARPDAPLVAARRLPDARFVLFSGSDPEVIERARAKLLQGGVPQSRIAAMPIEWRGPADVLRAVEGMGIAVAPGPRRPTHARLPDVLPAFPPPQHEGPPARQPLLSESVPVLDARTLEGDGASRRRLVVGASAGFAALALIIGIAARGDADTAADVATLTEVDAPAPVSAAWTSVDEASVPAQVDGEAVAVAGIVATPTPTPSEAPPAIEAPAAPPVPAPGVVAAPPITAAPALPASATPPVAAPPIPGEDVEPEPEPELDSEEMRAIYAGLVSQKFRALDILLIAPEPRKKVRKRYTKSPARMTWAAATAFCDGLDVAGVTGWRLPRVGELGSITTNELIADGKFWSQTEGDTFGRSRVVWNTQTSRMGTAPVKWKGGRVVCVRTMARPPETPETPETAAK